MGLLLFVLQFASYFTCVWSSVLLLFTISCAGCKCFGVETIANVIWLVYSHLVIFTPFFWRLSLHTYSWCLLHKHVVATVTTHRSDFCFVPVGAWNCRIMCMLIAFIWRSTWLVIPVFDTCGLFCIEVTLFGVMLVTAVTGRIGRTGFWRLWLFLAG